MGELFQCLDAGPENGSSIASAPPGFEYVRVPINGEENNNSVKDRARRRKEPRQKRGGKQRLDQVTEVEDEEWESDEEIEESESDEEGTWWVGTKTGLRADSENGAKKYLKSKEEEAKEIERKKGRNGKRRSKNATKEVGDSINCLQ
ncbi:hypothetical protein PIB30_025204 [Stylosanthes scabra]|uniref:Uncharacterized protein n=1 Tax=Stylosanthes scabra TaxID=79078 RepID=A0ABU6QA67_9FABA|nr:hypothetical protein [Stylosanthes scabra]